MANHRIDITGLNKAKILAALYNNAIRSNNKLTFRRRDHLGNTNSIDQIDIEFAHKILAETKNRVYTIGVVIIKINFDSNSIDASEYEKEYPDVEKVEDIINRLRGEIKARDKMILSA